MSAAPDDLAGLKARLRSYGNEHNQYPTVWVPVLAEAADAIEALQRQLSASRAEARENSEQMRAEFVEAYEIIEERAVEAEAQRDRLRHALATVLGDGTHGQRETWQERCAIGRAALSPPSRS